MRQRSFLLLIALVFIVSLALSLLVVLQEDTNPIPADLRDKVTFNADGSISAHGAITPAIWKEIGQIAHGTSFNPYQHWGVNLTDNHATASYVFFDAKLKGNPLPWMAPPGSAGWGPVFARLLTPIVNELKSMLRDAMGFFTSSASAACPTNSTCFWSTNASGNWSGT